MSAEFTFPIEVPLGGPSEPLFQSIRYVWNFYGTFNANDIDLPLVCNLLTTQKIALAATWSDSSFGEYNDLRWLSTIDRYIIPKGVSRIARLYLGKLNLLIEEDKLLLQVLKKDRVLLNTLILLCRNGSYVFAVHLNERFQSPLTPPELLNFICIGHPTKSYAWEIPDLSVGTEKSKYFRGSMGSVVETLVSTLDQHFHAWRYMKTYASYTPPEQFTMAVITDTQPEISDIEKFVTTHKTVLAAITNMDVFGLETRSQEALKTSFLTNLSIDTGLGVYLGEHSILILQQPNEYPPWVPHFKSLGLEPTNNNTMLLGIMHNYNVFVELVLCETATIAKYVNIYSNLSDSKIAKHEQFQDIKLTTSRELESLRNYPTNFSHGLSVISHVRHQLNTDDLLKRFERKREMLEDISKHHYLKNQHRLQLMLNGLVISVLGIQLATIILRHYEISPSSFEWLIWNLFGASLGPVVFLVLQIRSLSRFLLKDTKAIRKKRPRLHLLSIKIFISTRQKVVYCNARLLSMCIKVWRYLLAGDKFKSISSSFRKCANYFKSFKYGISRHLK